MNNSCSYLSQKCRCDIRVQPKRPKMVIFGHKNYAYFVRFMEFILIGDIWYGFWNAPPTGRVH
jgi:hypothetical protein